jgi:glyceraldehyde 3-phosphate dehydrogenase
MPADHPTEIPWDVFGVDIVIEATGRFRSLRNLTPHLDNGAPRVILSALPDENIDRVVLYGVNEESASSTDRIVSAGSASTTATALALKIITDAYAIEQATMTSVHAYTSDQSLQDYAGADYRRSRSGAENIIPNATPALHWVQEVLPVVAGKLSAYALNVPVQNGSMLDLTVAFSEPTVDAQTINELFEAAASARPALIGTTDDPIVSSDVKGSSQSLLVDLRGTMKAGERMVKLLAWHETLGHARRVLDVAGMYADLDAAQHKEAS